MPEEAIDLWPDDLETGRMTTPAAILRQQAVLLAKKTGNALTARVDGGALDRRLVRDPQNQGFHYSFEVVAPSLANYTFQLFTVRHGMDLYPVKLDFRVQERAYEAASEAEFIEVLRQVLSSPETKRVIETLLSQIET